MSSNRLQPLYLDGVGLPALPEGWSWKRFEDVVHAIPVGRKYDGKAVVADGVTPVIDQSVSGFMGHHNDEPGVMASALHPVFTFANHTCAMRWMTSPFSCIQNVFAFKGDSGFETQYLFYAAQGRVVLEEYKGHAPVFRSMLIPVPPFNEQRNIATFLASLDERITLLRETNATLEAIAQALFKSWFVDFDPVRAKMEGRTPEGMDEATAALFPDGFETSELGEVPRGWRVAKFEDFVQRLPVGKKFDQKTAKAEGVVPILDQGKSGVIGFHDEDPGVRASLDEPVVVFANHTCYMRLITHDFSAIQNVLPFKGKGIDTVWAFYATKGRVKFSEYKGHWPDFTIEKAVVPSPYLGEVFRSVVDPLMRRVRLNEVQSDSLARLRDTLLPRLISGQLRIPNAEMEATTA